MGKTATNISVVLGLITIAFAGYYFFTQNSSTAYKAQSNEVVMKDVLKKTSLFIQHRQVLNKIQLDISLFEDVRFTSLRSFSKPVEDVPVGRENPFDDTEYTNSLNSNNRI